MKKHKILLAVISALMATGMIFAAACGGGYSETQNNDKLALLDLVVDFGEIGRASCRERVSYSV